MLVPLLQQLDMLGLGLGEESEVAIFAATPRPTDFVISPPYYMHKMELYRNSLGFAAEQHSEVEQSELSEMMQLYRIATHEHFAGRIS